ncbi:hypothetical protein ACSVH2_04740 [Flavobacterium sp. RSB2_4_14]|uniref:hypothetical protein n=1 Tax=Flavobacterium sp. RSB2_4_14 TaxID=3447665 RepID=UPI003F3949BC
MKNITLLISLYLIGNLSYGQSVDKLINRSNDTIIFDNNIHKKVYQIKVAYSRLSVDLIEFNNGEYKGTVNINFDTQINGKWEKFVGKIDLESIIVEKLISKFYDIGIESIEDCIKNNDCAFILDGDDTKIEIYTNYLQKSVSFNSVTPKEKIIKNTALNRRQCIKIVRFLDKKINLEQKYIQMMSRLPKGKYSYFESISLATFNIK